MKTFTIHNATNTVTAHAAVKDAAAVPDAARFASQSALAKLAAGWPAARLIEIWNNLPGATPVRKFKDRDAAVSRIWKAVQSVGQPAQATADEPAPVIEPGSGFDHPAEVSAAFSLEESAPATADATPATPPAAHDPDVAPKKAPSRNKATRANKPPAVAKKKTGARTGSKTETILALMKRKGGTTLNEIMQAAGWQAHSVRGFISGTLGRKMGLTVISTKSADGQRSYSIEG
jgi:hypothetical protein